MSRTLIYICSYITRDKIVLHIKMPTKGALWLALYGTVSIALFAGSVVLLASRSVDHLTFMYELTNSFQLTILLNFVVCCALMIGAGFFTLFFGELRVIEIEHMTDQLPFYVLNLVFILFRDDDLLLNISWASITMVSKVFHIVVFDRLDLVELRVVNSIGTIPVSRASVMRTMALNSYVIMLFLFVVGDFAVAKLLAYDIFQGVNSVGSLLFGIQIAVLGMESFTYAGKYILNVYEIVFYRVDPQASEPAVEPAASVANDPETIVSKEENVEREAVDIEDGESTETIEADGEVIEDDENEDEEDEEDEALDIQWENKALYTQGFEILAGVFKSGFYLAFLYLLYIYSDLSMPFDIIQGIFFSFRGVYTKVKLLRRFLQHSRHLNEQLENATHEELTSGDNLCIICREVMRSAEHHERVKEKPIPVRKLPKKLKCGHILHMGCLKDWLERSNNCPLCRRVVFGPEAAAAPADIPVNPADGAAPAPVPHPAPRTEMAQPTDIGQVLPSSALFPDGGISSRAPLATPTDHGSAFTIPTDWVALPSTRTTDNSFTVRLSVANEATLTVRRNAE